MSSNDIDHITEETSIDAPPLAIMVVNEKGNQSSVYDAMHDHANGNYNHTFNIDDYITPVSKTVDSSTTHIPEPASTEYASGETVSVVTETVSSPKEVYHDDTESTYYDDNTIVAAAEPIVEPSSESAPAPVPAPDDAYEWEDSDSQVNPTPSEVPTRIEDHTQHKPLATRPTTASSHPHPHTPPRRSQHRPIPPTEPRMRTRPVSQRPATVGGRRAAPSFSATAPVEGEPARPLSRHRTASTQSVSGGTGFSLYKGRQKQPSKMPPTVRSQFYAALAQPVQRDLDAISATYSDQEHCVFEPQLSKVSRAKFPENSGFLDRLARYTKHRDLVRSTTPPLDDECSFSPRIYLTPSERRRRDEEKRRDPATRQRERDELYSRLAGYSVRSQQTAEKLSFKPALNRPRARQTQMQ